MTGFNNAVNRRHSCDWCGKQTYENRRIARQAAKRFHPSERLQAYRCRDGGQHWHIGHPTPKADQVHQTPTETPSQNPTHARTEPT